MFSLYISYQCFLFFIFFSMLFKIPFYMSRNFNSGESPASRSHADDQWEHTLGQFGRVRPWRKMLPGRQWREPGCSVSVPPPAMTVTVNLGSPTGNTENAPALCSAARVDLLSNCQELSLVPRRGWGWRALGVRSGPPWRRPRLSMQTCHLPSRWHDNGSSVGRAGPGALPL